MMKWFTLAVLALAATAASAQTTDLMITEYVEGSSYNKALEIFNGTEDTINLAGYAVERYSNGGTTPVVIPLDAVDLPSGETWVLTHPSFAGPAVADQTSSELNFNGDDALVLSFNGNPVDSFGRVGEDPGDFWSCGSGTTANHTLRRLAGVCSGDADPTDAFDPCAEWSFHTVDTFSGLDYHLADCGAVPEAGISWSGLKAGYR